MSKQTNKIWVNGYTRKNGSKVKGHYRSKHKNLAQIKMSDARKEWNKHLKKTHPDLTKTSDITYRFANKNWEENMDRTDTLGIDTKTNIPPIVKSFPKKPDFGQIVRLNGKDYVCDKNGKWKQVRL